MDIDNNRACALVEDGKVYCWGKNDGQVLDNESTDSTYFRQPTPLVGSASNLDIQQIELGTHVACAIVTNGTLWCWGNSNHGTLGNGNTGVYQSASQISFATNQDAQQERFSELQLELWTSATTRFLHGLRMFQLAFNS